MQLHENEIFAELIGATAEYFGLPAVYSDRE